MIESGLYKALWMAMTVLYEVQKIEKQPGLKKAIEAIERFMKENGIENPCGGNG